VTPVLNQFSNSNNSSLGIRQIRICEARVFVSRVFWAISCCLDGDRVLPVTYMATSPSFLYNSNITRAGLTIVPVPVVPWEAVGGAPRGGPDQLLNFYDAVLTFEHSV